jgi:hypothetical protein
MHKRAHRVAIASLPFLMLSAACSELPQPATYPTELQHTMASINHWSQFAGDIEQRIAPELKIAGDQSVCVIEPKIKTPFNQALQNYLVVSFFRAGFRTGACDGSVPSVKISTQLIRYRGDKSIWPVGVVAEVLTIGGGIVVATTLPTDTELIVTTSVQRFGVTTHMAVDGFYVGDDDWTLYEPPDLYARVSSSEMAIPYALTMPTLAQ